MLHLLFDVTHFVLQVTSSRWY